MHLSLRIRSTRRAAVLATCAVVVTMVVAACSSSTTDDAAPDGASTTVGAAAVSDCSASEWTTSWSAAPTDASFPMDATFAPLPEKFDDQTIRNVITPHLGSTGEVRLRLTNRFNKVPVTFERTTIGVSAPNGGVEAPVEVQFGGAASVTAAAGADVVSDPVALTFDAFTPLAVSIYLPATDAQLTKHWNSNATTFLTPTGGGDQTSSTAGDAFTQQAQTWLGVLGLDVQASSDARVVVALGDSITDGWVGASATETILDIGVTDQNVRYPDFLQKRFADAGIPISVANAGIGGNQILVGGAPTGPSSIERFADDVVSTPGVKGVIIFEGINDLGLSKAPADDIIAGLDQLIAQAKAADLQVWLATITPASDSVVDGVASAPNSERDRQVVNEWIRANTEVDGYFDFDEAVRDPANPAVLSTDYGSIDRLHLSPAGYEKIAATVDIEAIAAATC